MPPWMFFVLGGVSVYAYSKASRKKRKRRNGHKALPSGRGVLALGPACSTWEILDEPRADLLVRYAYVTSRLDGERDPYKITATAVKAIAPSCRVRGEEIRNAGELDLYIRVFESVLDELADDSVFTPGELEAYAVEFEGWVALQEARVG